MRTDALVWVLDEALESPSRTSSQILSAYKPLKVDGPKIRKTIRDVVVEAETMKGRSRETLLRWAMGEVLRRHFGRVDPTAVRRALESALGHLGLEVGK